MYRTKRWKNCPKCNSDWDGESIIEVFKRLRNEGNIAFSGMTDDEIENYVKDTYSPPYVFGRALEIEATDYDGTSHIRCPDCTTIFNFFTGVEENDIIY